MKKLWKEFKGTCIIVLCIFLGVAIIQETTRVVKRAQFEHCISNEPTDAVCDSCYYKVYKVHAYEL
jgi:hypothetical protein